MNQGPIWGQFMKKNSDQKSRATVPLSRKNRLFPYALQIRTYKILTSLYRTNFMFLHCFMYTIALFYYKPLWKFRLLITNCSIVLLLNWQRSLCWMFIYSKEKPCILLGIVIKCGIHFPALLLKGISSEN